MLEALLLVIDTPVTADALAAATEQTGLPGCGKATVDGHELTGPLWHRPAPHERGCTPAPGRALCRAVCWTAREPNSPGPRWAWQKVATTSQSRARVSAVRGVNVDAVMRTLLAPRPDHQVGTDADTGAVTFATASSSWALGIGDGAADRTAASRRRHN